MGRDAARTNPGDMTAPRLLRLCHGLASPLGTVLPPGQAVARSRFRIGQQTQAMTSRPRSPASKPETSAFRSVSRRDREPRLPAISDPKWPLRCADQAARGHVLVPRRWQCVVDVASCSARSARDSRPYSSSLCWQYHYGFRRWKRSKILLSLRSPQPISPILSKAASAAAAKGDSTPASLARATP